MPPSFRCESSDAVVYIAYAVFIDICAALLDQTPRGAPRVAELDFGKKLKGRNSIFKAFHPDGCSRDGVGLFSRYSRYVAGREQIGRQRLSPKTLPEASIADSAASLPWTSLVISKARMVLQTLRSCPSSAAHGLYFIYMEETCRVSGNAPHHGHPYLSSTGRNRKGWFYRRLAKRRRPPFSPSWRPKPW